MAARRRHRRHWYFISIDACVLCGREYVYRERRYTPRPRRWDKRHAYSQYACTGHFL